MTIVSTMDLGRELARTVSQINQQIEEVRKQAETMGIAAYEMRDTNGAFVLAPLLAAKAQTLHALVLINQRRN